MVLMVSDDDVTTLGHGRLNLSFSMVLMVASMHKIPYDITLQSRNGSIFERACHRQTNVSFKFTEGSKAIRAFTENEVVACTNFSKTNEIQLCSPSFIETNTTSGDTIFISFIDG